MTIRKTARPTGAGCTHSKLEMQIHSKSHTETKPHKYSRCSETFVSSSHLAQHIRVHSRPKPSMRNPSASSLVFSSTPESTPVVDRTNVHTRAVRRPLHNPPVCSLTDGGTAKINPPSAAVVMERTKMQPHLRLTDLHRW
ncbi:Zinc finger protein 384 [Lemmus lemmus]